MGNAGNTVYQIVYKSSYHGEVYSDPRAVKLPPDAAACPDAEIMEILKVKMPDNALKAKKSNITNGLYFTDLASAVAAMKTI